MAIRPKKKIAIKFDSSFNDVYGYGPATKTKTEPLPKKLPKRTIWNQLGGLTRIYNVGSVPPPREQCSEENADQANLISSLTETGTHMPVLDIDFPARLVPSSTPGHFHLYLEKEMTEAQYLEFLKKMFEAGVIEKDYLECSLRDKQSFLRINHDKHPPEYTKELDSETLINKAGASISEVRQVLNFWKAEIITGEGKERFQRYDKIDKVLKSVEGLLKEAL